MRRVSWQSFKEFIDNNAVPFFYVLNYGTYEIECSIGNFQLECLIDFKNPPSADQLEFETNYKDNANLEPVGKFQQTLGDDGYSFRGISTGLITASANQTTTFDFELDNNYALKGGYAFFEQRTLGDSIRVVVIDKNNILGLGVGVELGEYVPSWLVPKDYPLIIDDVSIAILPVAGLFLRIEYTNTHATNEAKGFINLIAYEVTS
jgi:hypothetical protein